MNRAQLLYQRSKQIELKGEWVELGALFEEERFTRTVRDGKTGRGRGKRGSYARHDDEPEDDRLEEPHDLP